MSPARPAAPKPLRALAGLMLIYASARVALVFVGNVPTAVAPRLPSVADLVAPPPNAEPPFPAVAPAAASSAPPDIPRPNAPRLGVIAQAAPRPSIPAWHRQVATAGQQPATPASPPISQRPAPAARDALLAVPPPGAMIAAAVSTRSALTGSLWLFARAGSGRRDLAATGTLGGSQAGARLTLAIGGGPLFATVRASGALAQRDREIAPGIGIRTRAGGLIVEQRLAIDGSRRSDTAALAYGGFSDVALPADFRLDGYAQAGIVGLSRRALFADGAVRAERTLLELGGARLSAGAGAWGAAQPGLARLDVGPQLVVRLPLAGLNTRLSAEYRFRMAGEARPASGPALSLGADF